MMNCRVERLLDHQIHFSNIRTLIFRDMSSKVPSHQKPKKLNMYQIIDLTVKSSHLLSSIKAYEYPIWHPLILIINFCHASIFFMSGLRPFYLQFNLH